MNESHVHSPRRYELSAAIGFAGQRRRVYDGLVRLAGVRPGDRVLDVGVRRKPFLAFVRATRPADRVVADV